MLKSLDQAVAGWHTGGMTATTQPTLNRAYILDLDLCDCSIALADKWDLADCTVADLDRCMREAAAEKSPAGGYAKLRFTLAFVTDGREETLEMRVDVDHAMREGTTLLECLQGRAAYWGSDRAAGSHGDPAVRAARKAFYESAVRAVGG